MILSLDLETSNLPPKGIEIGSDQYPWPVQAGCVLFELSGHDRAVFGSRIRSDNRTIHPAATAIHGITTREAGRSGIPEKTALSLICNLAAEASTLIGFNVAFDRDILVSSIIRLGQDPKKLVRPGLQVLDLMQPSTAFCKLPSERDTGEYRYPKLDEAMCMLRRERPRHGYHNALNDALRAKRLFLSLHHRGAIETSEAA